jgi:predicted dehydrogenase
MRVVVISAREEAAVKAALATDAEAMRDRARDAGVLHFLSFEFRFNEAWAALKKLADDGVAEAHAMDRLRATS